MGDLIDSFSISYLTHLHRSNPPQKKKYHMIHNKNRAHSNLWKSFRRSKATIHGCALFFQSFLLFCANLFTRAPRFHPRFSDLDLPQPLKNLFELGPNLFYSFVNLAFARAFFVSTFLAWHCKLTLTPISNMSYESWIHFKNRQFNLLFSMRARYTDFPNMYITC